MRKASLLFGAISMVAAFVLLNCGDEDDAPATAKNDSGSALPDTGGRPDASNPMPDSGTGPSDSGDGGSSGRTIFGVDEMNQLVKFSSTNTTVVTKVAITGVAGVHGIDFRPANGMLYALGADAKIYTINTTSGAATVVTGDAGSGTTFPIALDPAATSYGFDFNPVADRIRVHNNVGQNYRLHPINGESVNATSDGTLEYEGGTTAPIVASGYTNSVNPKPVATALFGIDATANQFVAFFSRDAPAPAGNFAGVRVVGPLGVEVDEVAGLDIYGGKSDPDAGGRVDQPIEAYAALRVGGELGLYTIDIATGKATKSGVIAHDKPLRGIAVQP